MANNDDAEELFFALWEVVSTITRNPQWEIVDSILNKDYRKTAGWENAMKVFRRYASELGHSDMSF